MPHIVLTPAQARVIEQTTLVVELRDEQGRILARIPPPSEQEIIERIKRNHREDQPRYAAADVQSRLARLQEIAQTEELDEARVKDLLHRMRAGEQV